MQLLLVPRLEGDQTLVHSSLQDGLSCHYVRLKQCHLVQHQTQVV